MAHRYPHGAVRIGAALAAILALPARTQEPGPPLITDRPDQTESAFVVPRGAFQLELGTVYSSDRNGLEPRVRSLNLGGALLRIGLAQPIELRLGFDGWQQAQQTGRRTARGAGDLSLGTKLQVTRGAGLTPAVALLGGLTLPVGHEAFRAEGVDPVVRASVAHDLGRGFSLGYNVGAFWTTEDRPGGGETTRTRALYSLVLGREVFDRLAVFVEGFGAARLGAGAPSWIAGDTGVTFALNPTLQLDLSAGVGLNGAADDWFLGAGLSARIPR